MRDEGGPTAPPAFDAPWAEQVRAAAGLTRLNPTWAKLEIILGLAAAAAGLRLLLGDGLAALGGGALVVLGLYLAMAGNRSHLYQSQNRQTAYLLQCLRQALEAEVRREP